MAENDEYPGDASPVESPTLDKGIVEPLAQRFRWHLVLGTAGVMLVLSMLAALIMGRSNADDIEVASSNATAASTTSAPPVAESPPSTTLPTVDRSASPSSTSTSRQPRTTTTSTRVPRTTTSTRAPHTTTSTTRPRPSTTTSTYTLLVDGVVDDPCGSPPCRVYLRGDPGGDLSQPSDSWYLHGDAVRIQCATRSQRVQDGESGAASDVWYRLDIGFYISALYVRPSRAPGFC